MSSPSVSISIGVGGGHDVEVELVGHVRLGGVEQAVDGEEAEGRRDPLASVNSAIYENCRSLLARKTHVDIRTKF